jgi:hypothetical protein
MNSDTPAYIMIATGLAAAVASGATFGTHYCIAFAVIAGGLTTLGVMWAQANAHDDGMHSEEWTHGEGRDE